jgi:epoxyqueuosine reductase
MAWILETFARRADPKTLWPGVRSVVVLAVNYGPADDPLEATRRSGAGTISVYARHRDYHEVIKRGG